MELGRPACWPAGSPLQGGRAFPPLGHQSSSTTSSHSPDLVIPHWCHSHLLMVTRCFLAEKCLRCITRRYKIRLGKGCVAEGWRINLSWELAMWFATAWYSLTWFSVHRPPAMSTLSSCSFNATSWSYAPHLCYMSSFLFISSCITYFFIPLPQLFLYLST